MLVTVSNSLQYRIRLVVTFAESLYLVSALLILTLVLALSGRFNTQSREWRLRVGLFVFVSSQSVLLGAGRCQSEELLSQLTHPLRALLQYDIIHWGWRCGFHSCYMWELPFYSVLINTVAVFWTLHFYFLRTSEGGRSSFGFIWRWIKPICHILLLPICMLFLSSPQFHVGGNGDITAFGCSEIKKVYVQVPLFIV